MSENLTDNTPTHGSSMQRFKVVDNGLRISGMSLERMAALAGQTPFYAYDRSILSAEVDKLRQSLPAGMQIHYAMKANPMPAVVQHVSHIVDGLDVASAAELRVALGAGVAPMSISFAGPGKSQEDLTAAVASGVIINLESENEMRRVADLATLMDMRPPVAVRVNPDFEVKASGMTMGGGAQPFGVDAERVPEMLEAMSELPLEFIGFHIFSGSQNLRAEAIVDIQTKTFELAFRLAERARQPVRWLNIGGGLGVPYFPGEQTLDLTAVAANLGTLVETAREKLPGVELVIELGRFLVAAAGIYVCKVIDIKDSRGDQFVVTNGGLHHHLSASGNFGQIIRRNYPVCIGNRVYSEEQRQFNIVGPLCTPLDILADKVTLPPAEIDDFVVVFQSGAYGYSASPHRFLSQPQPVEILV